MTNLGGGSQIWPAKIFSRTKIFNQNFMGFFIKRIVSKRTEMINFWKFWLFRHLTFFPVFFEKRLFLKSSQYCILILGGYGIILKYYTTRVHNHFKIIRDNRVVVSSDVPWDRVNCFSNSLSKSFIVGGIGF